MWRQSSQGGSVWLHRGEIEDPEVQAVAIKKSTQKACLPQTVDGLVY